MSIRNKILVILSIFICIWVFHWINLPSIISKNRYWSTVIKIIHEKDDKAKRILIYRNFFSDIMFPGIEEVVKNCSISHCNIIRSENVQDFDMVIIHFTEVNSFMMNYKKNILSEKKVMIIVAFESPWIVSRSLNVGYLRKNFHVYLFSFYNMSKFHLPYGNKHKKKYANISHKVVSKVPILEKKNACLALISNCENTTTKRLNYIKRLSEFYPVELLGKCTNSSSSREEGFKMIPRYKFYLSFENALCPDYITEKFWNPLILGSVPIVSGGGDYLSIAPPHSFIDARNFFDESRLAEYLKKLSLDNEKYNEYFKWRDNYDVRTTILNHYYDYGCEICNLLNKKMKKNYVYDPTLEQSVDTSKCYLL